jgi:hypothetical protein
MKKIFIISSVLACLVGVFYLIYNFLLVEDGINNQQNKETIVDIDDNKVVEKKIDKVAQVVGGKISNISLDETGSKIKYYNEDEKGFWLTSFDGSIKNKLSGDEFIGLEKVFWNERDKNQALLGIKDSFYLYTFENGEKIIKKTKALNWINFGQNIVYIYEDYASSRKTLNIANPDGSQWQEIAPLESDDVQIAVIPNSAKSSFWPMPDSFVESSMSIVAIGEKDLEKVGDLKFGADYLWSNDGRSFLRSSILQKGGSELILEVCDIKISDCINLNLPTMAMKCVWAGNNENIYCAVPQNIGADAIMPNDYFDNKFYTQDIFWKINIAENKKEKIAKDKLNGEWDAVDLEISPNEDYLFFIDKKTSQLFRIAL